MEPINTSLPRAPSPSFTPELQAEPAWPDLATISAPKLVPFGRVLRNAADIAEPLTRALAPAQSLSFQEASPLTRGIKTFWAVAMPVAVVGALVAGGVELASAVSQISTLLCAASLAVAMSIKPGHQEEPAHAPVQRD